MGADDRELPNHIDTDRLSLQLLTVEDARAMTAGERRSTWHDEYPGHDDVDAASMVGGGASSWGPRQIVTTGDGLVVGTIGFMSPPEAVAGTSEAEVGYGLVPSARHAGLATEALAGIVAAAARVSVAVRATVAADNLASRRVLEKCGFSLAGTTDDGLLLVRRAIESADRRRG
jgi:RimJ/RimL family protein N-acetyltransferase